MNTIKIYAWGVVLATATTTFVLFQPFDEPFPVSEILFWVVLLAVAELLPVTMGFETRITMGFPIFMASAIVFEPPVAMLIAGLGSFDSREFQRELPLHHALFNRAQAMLAVGVASSIIHISVGSLNLALLLVAAIAHLVVNLGLVAGAVHYEQKLPFSQVLRAIPPSPLAGFALTYLLLTGLGAATAVAYTRVGEGGEWVVIAILVPLLFARMTIQGAKAQEALSEKIRRQQEALLTATETVFQERERERARIAEHIHDSSLQMLAAAAYGCSNTAALLDAGKTERAKQTLSAADEAIHTAIGALRESLVDLRKASVEEGGLMLTISKFVDQLSVLWAARIRVEGEISHEPPIPVALAAFQILQEGVVNALKHSDGDEIVVRITEDESHMVHLVVEDEGPGFDPTKHVESDHVGMLLMKERAEGVGGEIKLQSAPGRGTRLEAILPAGVDRGMSLRILIVEDHRLVSQGLEMMLSMVDDFETVGIVRTGDEAVQRARDDKVDVVLMDVNLGQSLNGIEATRQIKSEVPDTKVLMLTMFTDPATVTEAVKAGADGYISKGAEGDAVERAIRDVMDGNSVLDPAVTSGVFGRLGDRDPGALSERELEVLQALAEGKSTKEIAEKVFLSEETVKTYLKQVFRKLAVRDRTEAVAEGFRRGLVH